MSDKILFVDDEPAVLDGYRRTLYREFQVETASSGEDALKLIASDGPFAVIVSDMRMPGMDGVRLLSQVRQASPDTVRVVLTGYADFQSAMDAVNDGAVFRFLTKPCETLTLKKALTGCLEQYRLVVSEKELLEKTLIGCVEALVDVLSLTNPAAFSRALRLRRYVQSLIVELKLNPPWKFEMAALLSQLGCVTIPPKIIEMARRGELLSSAQQKAFERHPTVASDLLKKIPRLEDIAWMVSHQNDKLGASVATVSGDLVLGAEALRVAIEFDDMKAKGMGDTDARERLKESSSLSPRALQSLRCVRPGADGVELRTVAVMALAVGMVLQEDVATSSGVLIAVRGQELSYSLIVCLNNFHRQGEIPDDLLVMCPTENAVAV
jgi:response regulator RpfG family c-di-GMP phosphodiesterase